MRAGGAHRTSGAVEEVMSFIFGVLAVEGETCVELLRIRLSAPPVPRAGLRGVPGRRPRS
ncbi:hypothetical protein GCM10025863_02740 [Microbacterium suwonense]|uniref:Uncharacterized protein n=1 Tax=Microbacterium suwonense TaxID=683047 RepID=A0ABN6WYQ8_9MICO|nr:hypothetical protein GCM10025863_02740 [Microbacterium suwonense]